MASSTFKRLPGFRDFPPEDLAFREHIFRAWRGVSSRYAFQEYDGPPLEPLDLYVEKSGEEIVGQLYNFTDKGGREVALRPEMTPSLARILGERSRGMPKPIRWFSIPQLFRYERQQRGRLREHFQWNVDIVGEGGVAADAEILAVALDALRELGLGAEDVRARVSDRRLLMAVLKEMGVSDDAMPSAFALIDKIERMPDEAAREKLAAEVGLAPGDVERALETLGAHSIEALTDAFTGASGVLEALEPLKAYVETLRDLGFADFVEVDLRIVRGLAYYTGIVFEIFDRRGEFRAVCGGGRYDRLLELVGGEPLPAVGFGMGDVVLGELLKERGLAPEYRKRVDYFVVAIGEEQRPAALGLAARLRRKGRSVAYALREQSVRKQFKAAEAEGADRVLILGPDEAARGEVIVRDMGTGEETPTAMEALS
ncbi:MAG: histidine--tRNA ligase [Gemmatimonadota bacterium]